MKTKRVLTVNLQPDMKTAESVYSDTNNLIIPINTVLTGEIINKLKYYSIKSVKILVEEPSEESSEETAVVHDKAPTANEAQEKQNIYNPEYPTYFDRIHQSEEFKTFESTLNTCITDFSKSVNRLVTESADGIVDEMLNQINSIIDKSRNPLHMLDMMQCMRDIDDQTYAHSINVSLISGVIGTWLHLSKDDLEVLLLSGMLHDIGKLRISPETIHKPGKLTDEEFETIKRHPVFGHEILNPKKLDKRIKLAALQHHERFDGSGYPFGLSGEQIDFFASIVAIADVYDAMTSARSYRKGICPFPVLQQMEYDKNLYNPTVLCKFLEHTVEAYVNTEVMLSTGEKGKVVLVNKNFISRPIVIAGNKTYDLSKDYNTQITALI